MNDRLGKFSDLQSVQEAFSKDKVGVTERGERIPIDRLNRAIEEGIARADTRMRRYRRSRRAWRVWWAMMTLFILITAAVNISPAFASMMRAIPGISGFIKLIDSNPAMRTAFHHEFVQPVHLSDEGLAYKLTVNGIIADHQRLLVLYTLEGGDIHRSSMSPYADITDLQGNQLEAALMYSYFPGEQESEGIMQDYIDVILAEGVEMPDGIVLSMHLEGERLQVEVPIEHERFKDMVEVIQINQVVEIAGQKLTIEQATVTPLQVSVKMSSHRSNPKHINAFIGLELVDEEGRRYRSKGGFGDVDSSFTKHFDSPYLIRPEKLSMVAKGLYLSDRGLSVTIDTEKKQLIDAPDERLMLAKVTEVGDEIRIGITLQGNVAHNEHVFLELLSYDGGFRDASGKEYKLLDTGVRNGSFREGSQQMTYIIAKEQYKQPLTFDIQEYPGYVLDDMSVEIK